jgi:hypothetical protein
VGEGVRPERRGLEKAESEVDASGPQKAGEETVAVRASHDGEDNRGKDNHHAQADVAE